MEIKDMPKLESPFEREERKGGYYCVPKFKEEFKWIFDKTKCLPSEKFDGTNVSILIEDGQIKGIWNRTNRIPFFNKGTKFISEGLLNSYELGYMEFLEDDQHFGELIGKKVNRNPYEIENHLWLSLKKIRKKFEYKFWDGFVEELDLTEPLENCPKLLNQVSELFKVLKSRWFIKKGEKEKYAEGIVFFNKDTGVMCKLRRNMFEFFKGQKHKPKLEKYKESGD